MRMLIHSFEDDPSSGYNKSRDCSFDMKLPQSIQDLIWWAKANPVKNRKQLITAIFTHGDIDQIRWALKHLPASDLKESVEQPLKGEWDKKSLSFFCRYFDVELSPVQRQQALKSITF